MRSYHLNDKSNKQKLFKRWHITFYCGFKDRELLFINRKFTPLTPITNMHNWRLISIQNIFSYIVKVIVFFFCSIAVIVGVYYIFDLMKTQFFSQILAITIFGLAIITLALLIRYKESDDKFET